MKAKFLLLVPRDTKLPAVEVLGPLFVKLTSHGHLQPAATELVSICFLLVPVYVSPNLITEKFSFDSYFFLSVTDFCIRGRIAKILCG